MMGPRYSLKYLSSGKFGSRVYFFLRKTEIFLSKKNVTYGLNCYLCVAYSLFLRQPRRQRMHLFVERDRGQGKKQKPEDCAIMAFLNPSRKFVFLVLWKSKAQLLKKESLPGDCSPDATVHWIFLVHMLLGTSIRSPWGRQATVSAPRPEQAYPFPQ